MKIRRQIIDRLDHLVLTVADPERTREFYGRVLGVPAVTNGKGGVSLVFGKQKINLHRSGAEWAPHARTPTPGSGDFCLITREDIDRVVDHLGSVGVELVEGPVQREGALGPMRSVYFFDPDGNLVEVSQYIGK